MTCEPTIRSQADLEAAWRTLMEPLGFSSHSVWIMLIGADGRPIPQLTKIDEAEDAPTEAELAGLADVLTTVQAELAPGGEVAFLRSRPGSGGLTAVDRAWASALYEVGRLTGVRVAVVHQACDVDLVPVPMDEVLPRGA